MQTSAVLLLGLATGASALAQPCTPAWLSTFHPQDLAARPQQPQVISTGVLFDDDGPGPHAPTLYIGGTFYSIGGRSIPGLARWTGAGWEGVPGNTQQADDLAVFDDDGPGPHAPALYAIAAARDGLRRWDGQQWTVVSSGLPIWSISDPHLEWWAGGLHVIDDDGPGPDPERLYVSVCAQQAWPYYLEVYGSLARLDPGGWTTVFSGGAISNAAYFDPGPGAGPAGIYIASRTYTAMNLMTDATTTLSVVTPAGAQTLFSLHGTEYDFGGPTILDPDGAGPARPELLISGDLAAAQGLPPAPRIARVDGQNPTIIAQADGPIENLSSIPQDPTNAGRPSLYASGGFATIAGVAANHIARFDGAAWSPMGPGLATAPPYGPEVAAIVPFDQDGPGPLPTRLFTLGEFDTAGYSPLNGVAVWDGSTWLAPGQVLDNEVHALLSADLGDGPSIYAAGAFVHAGGQFTPGIARWNGASWAVLGAGFNNHADALAIYNDNGTPRLVAAGKFTGSGPTPLNHIAIWRNNAWQPLGGGLNGNVSCLLGVNGTLYAGGSFTSAAGAPAAQHLAAWDGSAWRSLGRFNADVNSLAFYQGSLHAGGAFDSITDPNGTPAARFRIARFDGAHWNSLGSGVGAPVHAMTVYDDGSGASLYVGGEFVTAGGSPANRIARWDGSGWLPLGLGVNGGAQPVTVSALTVVHEDVRDALYVGGNFSSANGQPAASLARWNGQQWSPVDGGVAGAVLALASLDNSGPGPRQPTLFAGGVFLTAGPGPSWFLARYHLCACYPNCDGSTTPPVLNVNDFLCFLAAFSAASPYANCDNSTTPPVMNVNDFICFMGRFAQGCP